MKQSLCLKKTFLQHSSLGLDKAEWLEDIRKGSCSLKSFLGVAGEGIDERESGKFEEGLNSKVQLSLFRLLLSEMDQSDCEFRGNYP